MKGSFLTFLLLAAVLWFGHALPDLSDITAKERTSVIDRTIAKVKAMHKEKVKASETSTSKSVHGSYYVNPHLLESGYAHTNFERAVRIAEAELVKLKYKDVLKGDDKLAKAEALAEAAFHTPGSYLTKSELARMQSAMGECRPDPPVPTCGPETRNSRAIFRSFDGTCNNLDNPLRGAAGVTLRRLLAPQFEDGIQQTIGFNQQANGDFFGLGRFDPPNPSARAVVNSIHPPRPFDDPVHSHLLMAFGQFLDHDMAFTPIFQGCSGCDFSGECIPIFVPSDDTGFSAPQECITVGRAIPACDEPGRIEPRRVFNELTAFLDCSMVYGSEPKRINFLRELEGGRLKVGPGSFRGAKPNLPHITQAEANDPELLTFCESQGCFAAGEQRPNENTPLTVIHTIFMREHNRVAAALGNINPQWDDETIFQNSRAIVIGEFQAMVYEEYLPSIFGRELFQALIGSYDGYDESVDPTLTSIFATAGFRFGHSLIRPDFARLNEDGTKFAHPLRLVDSFSDFIANFNNSGGTDPLMRGLLRQPSRQADEYFTSDVINRLFGFDLDLISLNIQRGRDHGLPRFLVWRDFCGKFLTSRGINVEPTNLGIFNSSINAMNIERMFGTLDTVDPFTGITAEAKFKGRSSESILGITQACIFALQFNDLRAGDRFFYENPGVFTPAQVAELKSASLSKVICDNADNIPRIQRNALRLANRITNPIVSCGSLHTPNLELWRENGPSCFARMSVSGTVPRGFSLSSNTRNDNCMGFTNSQMLVADNVDRPVCFQFECPEVFTKVFVSPSVPDLCTVKQNAALPASTARNTGSYEELWNSQLLVPSSGIYQSLAACQNGQVDALEFSCPGRPITVVSEVTGSKSAEPKKDDALLHALEDALADLK